MTEVTTNFEVSPSTSPCPSEFIARSREGMFVEARLAKIEFVMANMKDQMEMSEESIEMLEVELPKKCCRGRPEGWQHSAE